MFKKLLLFILVVALLGSSRRCSPELRKPSRFQSVLALIRDERLVLLGSQGEPYKVGLHPVVNRTAGIVSWSQEKLESVEILGAGGVIDASVSLGGDLYAVVVAWFQEKGQLPAKLPAVLWKNSLNSDAWKKIGIPEEHIIGASFQNGSRGFVWSTDTVYCTIDGGKMWSPVNLDGIIGRVRSRPELTEDGSLLVAVNHGSTHDSNNSISRIEVSTKIQKLCSDVPYPIYMMKCVEDTLWTLSVSNDEELILHRSRLQGSVSFDAVREFNATLPKYLHASKGWILVVVTTVDDFRKSDSAYMSEDNGRTWSQCRLPERSILDVVASDEAGVFWVLGSDGVVYPPTAK